MPFNLIDYISSLDAIEEFDGEDLYNKLSKPFYLSNIHLNPPKQEHPLQPILSSAIRSKVKHAANEAIKALTFKDVESLHSLWCAYISKLFPDVPTKPAKSISSSWMTQDDLAKSVKIDLHGAFISIASSKCRSQTGKSGIIIQETSKTIVLISPNNRISRIPKQGTVIECSFPIGEKGENYTIFIFGDRIARINPAERMVKKFKAH